ncbi:MAG: hypothetical protein JWM56_1317 [Candidatus Peribacteria bacterium]|nr:hypothetical protein [Candidatus Peribacteria bacterium]
MNTLFLNLASHQSLIACVHTGQVVSRAELHPRMTDLDLMQAFEAVVTQAGWKHADVNRIACVLGLGGFTSLRVACAFTNALSFALGIPSAGIHLSEVKLAQGSRGFKSPATRGAWWLHSTKKDLLFIRGFGKFTEIKPEPECISIADLGTYVHAGDAWTGELIPEHESLVQAKGMLKADEKLVQEILPQFLDMLTYESQTLLPWYGRGW